MNTYQKKDNIFKNGWYHPDHSKAMANEKKTSKVPTMKQVKYRDDLYNFCVQKGLLRDGFPLARTKQGITSNIRAFRTIIKKNGLEDEFFGERNGT